MLRIGWVIIWITIQRPNYFAVFADVNCPVDDYGGFIADPTACEKFYYCDQNGLATSVYCPEGMWFNPRKRICDLPANVKCIAKETTNVPEEENIQCPSYDTSFVTFVPSKVNCRRYYLCYYGRPFKQECIAELHWNARKNRCDFPSKAKCSIQLPKPRCPERGQDLMAHPSECDYFYFCINGYASLQQCPFYHHWDVDSQSCQWKNRARCVNDPDYDVNYKKTVKKGKKRA